MSLQIFAYGSICKREDARRTAGTQFLAKQIFLETDSPTLAGIIAASEGIFEKLFEKLSQDRDLEYLLIDSTIVRAHACSSGAQKNTASKA